MELNRSLRDIRDNDMWSKWIDEDKSFEQLVIRLIVVSYLIEKGVTSGLV